jgi:exodeoxyribonuclease V alpha subunit
MEDQVIEGVIKKVTFNNPHNGFSVLQVETNKDLEQVVVVGPILEAKVGLHIVAQGSFLDHPKFGLQFTASSIHESVPTDREKLANYLGNRLIPGIGKRLAKRIIAKIGDEPLKVLSTDPDLIASVPGISKEKALAIVSHFQSQSARDGIIRLCQKHGIGQGLAAKIYAFYKDRSLSVLKDNPYRLIDDIPRVGFLTADKIAREFGIPDDAPQRIKAALLFIFERASEEGHCYLTEHQISSKLRSLIPENIETQSYLDELIREKRLTRHEDRVALTALATAEDIVARFILDRLGSKSHSGSVPLEEIESEVGIRFSHEQRDSLIRAQESSLFLITGGPGCGKTTVVRGLTSLFRKQGLEVALTAPTGRAAQRLGSVCAHPASTVHRLLKFDPQTGGFQHGIHNPLQADVVIVDESSMLDIYLFRDLVLSLTPETKLILVGDKDQLPSVGPGRVFADLLSIREIPAVSLLKLFRRDEASSINSVAFQINHGEVPEIPTPDGVTKSDVYFLPTKGADESSRLVENLVCSQIPKKFGIPPSDILVISPGNRGEAGTENLNKRLQDRLTNVTEEQSLELGDLRLRVGDKVIQRVNNYNIDPQGVFNGDSGIVKGIDRSGKRVMIELWDKRFIVYERDSLNQLSLGYAVTVHRAQGSESRCVVIILDESHFTLLERQLFYTAVTRAKELLIIVGTKKALMLATRRNQGVKRQTSLAMRIRDEL